MKQQIIRETQTVSFYMTIINNSGILSLQDDKMSASTFAFTEENNRQPLFNYGKLWEQATFSILNNGTKKVVTNFYLL